MSFSSTAIRRIYKEVLELRKSPPAGFQIVECESSDLDLVDLTLEGPEQTPFENGIFHLRLHFTAQYPSAPPNANFITKIFHPNIAPRTGEICVNTLKRDWNNKVTLSEILMTIKSLLVDPNPTSALNEEAGKLLLEDYPAYCSHAKLFTEVHAMKPKPLVIPPKSPVKSAPIGSTESPPRRSTSRSSTTPFASSQAQNAPSEGTETKRKLLLLGIGLKKAEEEDAENRPSKRKLGVRRAGKGGLRRL